METKTYQGTEYTKVGDGEWKSADTGWVWDTCEIADIKSQIKDAEKQMARLAVAGLDDYDRAYEYSEAADQRNEKEADLELLEYLAA